MKKTFLIFTLIILCIFCMSCTCSNSTTETDNPTKVSGDISDDEGNMKLEPSYGYYFGIVNGNLSGDAISEYDSLCWRTTDS